MEQILLSQYVSNKKLYRTEDDSIVLSKLLIFRQNKSVSDIDKQLIISMTYK